MLGGGPVWKLTFYPTRTRSANSDSEQKLSGGSVGEIDLEKEEGFVVRHEGEIRDVEVRAANSVKVVVQIKKQEAVSGGVRRQNIGPESDGPKRGCHVNPILVVARTLWRTRERKGTVRANIGVGRQERAVGDFLRRKGVQTLAVLAGLRNNQLDRSSVQADGDVIVILKIDIDRDDACTVERILAEGLLGIAGSSDIGVGDDGQVLMRVAGAQRHRVGWRALA